MKNKTKNIENRILYSVYSTPNRLSIAVLLTVHLLFIITQAINGNNYLQVKLNQILNYPILASFEILIPYFVTYFYNFNFRRLNN